MEKEVRSSLIERRGYRQDIEGNALSLYLSSYPVTARFLAERIGDSRKTILELCCGIGVNMEFLVPKFYRVIGVDNDRETLLACEKNLKKANIEGTVELIQADVRDEEFFKRIQADVVLYDIPYWYPEKYQKFISGAPVAVNPDLKDVIANVRNYISEDIVIFAPPEMGYEFFKEKIGECECLNIFIGERHDRNFLFFGNLMKQAGEDRVVLTT